MLTDKEKVLVFDAAEALRSLSPELRRRALSYVENVADRKPNGAVKQPPVKRTVLKPYKPPGRMRSPKRANLRKVEAWVKNRKRTFVLGTMANALGCTKPAATQWCLVLTASGLIERVKRGVYIPSHTRGAS